MNDLEKKEIEIKPILEVIVKRLWIVVLLTIFFGGAGTYYSNSTQPDPLYSATSTIIVEENVNMNTMKVFITEPIVMEEVVKKLSLNISASQLSNQVEAIDLEDSQIIQVSVIFDSPVKASLIANTIGDVFPEVLNERLGYSEVGLLSESLVHNSMSPINPPNNSLSYASFALGMIIGIGVSLLLNSIDNKIRTEREIETLLKVPVLGSVSNTKRIPYVNNIFKKKSSLRGETIV
ncbi:YveK family protein [Salipaludibacillus sp. HK11]|uniref:YveK family protein n=1 Tax=Salipaludibacillus sp. HK11 TaxID=3394320 RepID=UPI0039FD47C3